MGAILQILVVMAALTLVGVGLRRWLTGAHAARLNDVALKVTLPAAIFLSVHRLRLDAAVLVAPALFFVTTLLVWLIAEAVARQLALDAKAHATFVLSAVFGNIIYIGYPMAAALHGEAGLAQAILVDQVGLEPLAFTLGPLLAARGGAPGTFSWRAQLAGLLRFPPLVAFAAGLMWNVGGLPPWPPAGQWLLRAAGLATVPLVMLAFGLVLRFGALRQVMKEAVGVGLLRLVVAPGLALVASRLVGLEDWRTSVVTLQAATPTMMFTLVLATRFGLDVERSAGFITATMLASAITLPVWAALLG